MAERTADGSAGDADYAAIGTSYSRYRRPDSRIAAAIMAALGDAQTVLNVGAGAGSYEPVDRTVTAVEPSASMRAQRPGHLPAAVDATAEALPFPDRTFDAARLSCSAWSFVDPSVHERFVADLAHDLETGVWDDRLGALRRQPTFEGSLVLVVSRP